MCSQTGYTPQHNWANEENPDVTKQGFMLLTLSWPGSFCAKAKGGCHTTVQIQPDFTIHGLWPNNARHGYPSCCEMNGQQVSGESVQATVNADPELAADLADEWPDFQKSNFIAYEFNKHGTCAMDIFDTPMDYIKTAIALKKQFDFYGALGLTEDELLDGAERTPDQLHHAFQTQASKTLVILACNNHELSEIRVCVRRNADKVVVPFNCPQSAMTESTCDRLGDVVIPPWIPLGAPAATGDGSDSGNSDSGKDEL